MRSPLKPPLGPALGLCWAALLAAGCGRLGFDLLDEPFNAPSDDAAVDDSQPTPTDSAPPEVAWIIATSSEAPFDPVSLGDLQVGSGGDAFIRWRATDDVGLSAGSIALYETVDDVIYNEIATGLDNGSNDGCTIDGSSSADDGATGCHRYLAARGTYFRIQVRATDDEGQVGSATSQPLNSADVRFVAGPAAPGTGGTALRAALISSRTTPLYSDAQSFVVTADGAIFYRDRYRGLLYIDPATLVQELLTPMTGTASGDGGPARQATLESPIKLALDPQERLLIYDGERIRRVDIRVPDMPITTIIGGGASTADDADALDVQIRPQSNVAHHIAKWRMFTGAPSGDIYFQSEDNSGRIRHYHQSTGRVTSVHFSGTDPRPGGGSVTECWLQQPAVEWAADTGAPQRLFVRMRGGPPTYPNCVDGDGWAFTTLDGAVSGPHPPSTPPNPTAAAGRFFTPASGVLHMGAMTVNRLFRLDHESLTWAPILGSGQLGRCPDGTLALECDLELDDSFVNREGRVYFFDHGQIRMVDDNDRVVTLVGGRLSDGDGSPSLQARIRNISGFGLWDDGARRHVTVLDFEDILLRDLAIDGDASTRAGDFSNRVPATDQPATAQGLSVKMSNSTTYPTIALHPTTGTVFYNRGTAHVGALSRQAGRWSDVVGGGTVPYYDAGADGSTGGQIEILSQYQPTIFGLREGRIAVGLYWYEPSSLRDAFINEYDTRTFRQTHLVGQVGTLTPSATQEFCADGTSLDACTIPRAMVGHIRFGGWDSYRAGWLAARGDAVHLLAPGGSMQTVQSSPSIPDGAFAQYADGFGDEVWFFCESGRLQAYRPSDGSVTELTLPNAQMSCGGETIVYDAAHGSVFFAFQQLGLYGVAEHLRVDAAGATVDEYFDRGGLTNNVDGVGSGFVVHGAAREERSSFFAPELATNEGRSGVASQDTVSIASPSGATVRWMTRRVSVSNDQATSWTEPAADAADWAFELALVSESRARSASSSLSDNTDGGVYLTLYYERGAAADDLTVTGSLRVTSSAKLAGCDDDGCPGVTTLATFSFNEYAGQSLITAGLRLTASGWAARFDQAVTVNSGILQGNWTDLGAPPFTNEFDAGAYVAATGRNLGAGRGSGHLDRVVVR